MMSDEFTVADTDITSWDMMVKLRKERDKWQTIAKMFLYDFEQAAEMYHREKLVDNGL